MLLSEKSTTSPYRDDSFSLDDGSSDTSNLLPPASKKDTSRARDLDPEARDPHHVRNHEKPRLIIACLLTFLSTILAMLSLYFLCHRPLPSKYNALHPLYTYDAAFTRSRPGSQSCGPTVAAAMASGCIFDELSDLWVPPHCDQSYRDEYITSHHGGPQRYWLDPLGQHEIFNRSLYIGDDNTYWSTEENHILHCRFNLFRLAKSLKEGTLVGHDGDDGFSGHVEHCARLMSDWAMKAEGLNKIDVATTGHFGFC